MANPGKNPPRRRPIVVRGEKGRFNGTIGFGKDDVPTVGSTPGWVEVPGGAAVDTADMDELVRRMRERLGDEPAADQAPEPVTEPEPQLTPEQVREQNRELFFAQIASRREMSVDAVRAEFETLTAEVRGQDQPVTYTTNNRALSSTYGLGSSPETVHAVTYLVARARRAEARLSEGSPRRITRLPVPDGIQTTNPNDPDAPRVVEAGYDARISRLEVVVYNPRTGERTEHAYRNVPPYLAQRITDQNATTSWYGAGQAWESSIRGGAHYQYADAEEAAAASLCPRCTTCGQWADASHACPRSENATVLSEGYGRGNRWSRQRYAYSGTHEDGTTYRGEISVPLPQVRQIRETFQNGPVQIRGIGAYWDDRNSLGALPDTRHYSVVRVTGDATAFRDEANGIAVNTSQLACTCPQYRQNSTCPHIDLVGETIRLRLDPPPRTPAAARTPEEREALVRQQQLRAEAAAATDWTRDEETLAEARRTWRENSEVSYSEDFEAFERDYNAAVSERAAKNGAPSIPYMYENALGGLGTRALGQGFAPEIEADLPMDWTYQQKEDAIKGLAQDLYDAGLTWSPNIQGYHASKMRGYRDTHKDPDGKGNWTLEYDGSVAVELVPPIMFDEPDTWKNLETALELMEKNGFVVSERIGSHVHIGTGYYNGDAAKYAELARLYAQHEDVLFRLATDPARGKHRNNGSARSYSSVNPDVPPRGFQGIYDVRNWQGYRNRTRALNMMGVTDDQGSHPEFRLFDGTLNKAAVQSQIKVAVAMGAAAARNADLGGTQRKKEPLGSHATRARIRGRRRRTEEEQREILKEDTATFRSFMDTLFTRAEDKRQMTALFVATNWAKGSTARSR